MFVGADALCVAVIVGVEGWKNCTGIGYEDGEEGVCGVGVWGICEAWWRDGEARI
jgi:hypothetical protein